jgi:hypothetical protein
MGFIFELASYLKVNDNRAMKKMIDEDIVPKVVDSINKDPKKVGEITQKIAEIITSKQEFTNNLITQPKFINNLLGSQQFQAVIQTLIMSTNTSLSPEIKYYVVTGSSFTKNIVESDKETARNVKLSSKICISNSHPPAYLMVVAPQENQDFQLDLNTAKKTLELANTVPLFKQNGAYFIAIKDDLFFKCP